MVARDGGPPRLEAVFPSPEGGFSAHAVGPILAHLELAYALTVHKAQGSEYERVVIVLPSEDTPFVSREILYTALTRAKRVVTIVGSREVILQAAQNLGRRGEGRDASGVLKHLLTSLDRSRNFEPLRREYNVGPAGRVVVTRNPRGKVTLAFPKGLRVTDHEGAIAAFTQILKDLG